MASLGLEEETQVESKEVRWAGGCWAGAGSRVAAKAPEPPVGAGREAAVTAVEVMVLAQLVGIAGMEEVRLGIQ